MNERSEDRATDDKINSAKIINTERQHYKIPDHVSTRIDSFGKCALDCSEAYVDSIFEENKKVKRVRKNLESIKELNVPDFILDEYHERLERCESSVKADIIKNQDPEEYRKILERWKDNSLGEDNKSFRFKHKIHLFNEIFNKWESSQFIDSQLGFCESDGPVKKDYVNQILAKDEKVGYKFNTEQFRNFLQWHNYEHRKTEKEFQENLPAYKNEFRDKIECGVLDGTLPKNALNNIDEIDRQEFIIDDGLDCIESDLLGYQHDWGINKPTILLSPSEGLKFKVFAHEGLHAIGAKNYLDGPAEYPYDMYHFWATEQSGYNYDIDDDDDLGHFYEESTRVLREATCESLTAKIANVPEKELSYEAERYFVKRLIELSEHRIQNSDLESMFFENDFNKFSESMQKIQNAFQNVEDIMLEIGQIQKWNYSKEPAKSSKEEMLEIIFHSVHPKTGYDRNRPESRFLNNQAYLDYLKDTIY